MAQVEKIADFVETYGGYPPSPWGRRAKLAQEIRDKSGDLDLVSDIADYIRNWHDRPAREGSARANLVKDVEDGKWEDEN